MTNNFNAFIRYVSRTYFSYWIIWGIDILISLMSSCLSFWGISYMIEGVLPSEGGLYLSVASLFVSGLSTYVFRTYRNTVRYSHLRGLWRICCCALLKSLLLGGLVYYVLPDIQLSGGEKLIFLLFDGMLTIIALFVFRMLMVIIYESLLSVVNRPNTNLLIYGTDQKCVALKARLANSSHYKVVGFLTYGRITRHRTLSELPIFNFKEERDLHLLVRKRQIQAILFRYDDMRSEEKRLLQYCKDNGVRCLIAPTISEADSDGNFHQWVRPVKIEDLLGRAEININLKQVAEEFSGKVVLVTGAAGSIGSELCRQLVQMGIQKLIMFDSAETPLHTVRLEFEKTYPTIDFVPVIGDVRVKERVRMVFELYHPQVVFHAAAYKHVPLMEENPCEAVLVNVVGTRQVADMAVEYGAEKMIMVSTDKAVNPTNIMGCSKRLAEIYVQSLGCAIREGKVKGHTKFITTRFGNVLGSNGSVIPRFSEQIENGGPVTVTHPDIIRFFMTIPEACRLVMEAATMGEGNEIFVFEMGEAVKIVDLATRMIELAGYRPGKDINIEFTGLRPGEKLYEEVLSDKENTLPTENKKIMIAKVRRYEYADIIDAYAEFERLSRAVKIMDMVRLMKGVVPEFKSKNSPKFEVLDHEL